MQAGRLRDRVTIQNFTTSRSPSGQPQKLWLNVATVRAEIKGVSGREMMTADAERAESTIRVWIRYRSDITAASRILCLTGTFKGKVLDVSGPPIPDSKGVRLEILCKQGVEP